MRSLRVPKLRNMFPGCALGRVMDITLEGRKCEDY